MESLSGYARKLDLTPRQKHNSGGKEAGTRCIHIWLLEKGPCCEEWGAPLLTELVRI